SELHSIRKQIDQNLSHSLVIAAIDGRWIRDGKHRELQPTRSRLRLDQCDRGGERSTGRARTGANLESTGFNLGEIENVVDEAEEVYRAHANAANLLSHLLGGRPGDSKIHQLRVASNYDERG